MHEIAAVIISKNGALRIGLTITSLKMWANSIHVFVDTSTTDNTREVAAAHGAIVHDITTPGYVEGALEQASRTPGTRFVLRLDDDERFIIVGDQDPAVHRTRLLATMDEQQITHFWFHRRWMLPGDAHYIVSKPWYPDLQVRLFDLKYDPMTWPQRPHDYPKFGGRGAVSTDACIDHLVFCYTKRVDLRAKAAAYTALNPEASAVEQYYNYEDYRLEIWPTKYINFSDTLITN